MIHVPSTYCIRTSTRYNSAMNTQSHIRTRFAPSPTGYLHIGGARTALFCWLFARHFGGTFVLRIEDTDQERSTPESIQAILDGMEWLGLDYDEGPFYQMQRMDRYREVIDQLLETGHAYRCYCSRERLDNVRAEQQASKQKPRYDGHCRDLTDQDVSQPHVIRFKNPVDGEVSFADLVRGTITVANSELDDLIIARTDGTPTYNLTVVVDDWDMKITHVIRGDDHINNTPRQINIFKALDAEMPLYAHVPMILGGDGKRLSKRHGAVSVMQYHEDGYLPQAMLNYLLRLGWSHGDQEVFLRDEMIELFNLDSVNRSPAAFNEEKLQWLNQHYMKTSDPSTLVKSFSYQLEKLGVSVDNGPTLEAVIEAQAERCKTLVEMAEKSSYFFADFTEYDEKAAKKNLKPAIQEALQAVLESYSSFTDWDQEKLHQVIVDTAEKHDLKLGKLAQPIRVAVTGGAVSPPLDVTIALIGKERVLKRLSHAIDFMAAQQV
jgi:glutamyl-tRNA synthetase